MFMMSSVIRNNTYANVVVKCGVEYEIEELAQ